MEILCPNCKHTADHVTIDEVDFINCPECGWFQVQADGSATVCDPPSSKLDPPPEPVVLGEGPAATPGDDDQIHNSELQLSPGKPDPDDDNDDDSGIEIEITFED